MIVVQEIRALRRDCLVRPFISCNLSDLATATVDAVEVRATWLFAIEVVASRTTSANLIESADVQVEALFDAVRLGVVRISQDLQVFRHALAVRAVFESSRASVL